MTRFYVTDSTASIPSESAFVERSVSSTHTPLNSGAQDTPTVSGATTAFTYVYWSSGEQPHNAADWPTGGYGYSLDIATNGSDLSTLPYFGRFSSNGSTTVRLVAVAPSLTGTGIKTSTGNSTPFNDPVGRADTDRFGLLLETTNGNMMTTETIGIRYSDSDTWIEGTGFAPPSAGETGTADGSFGFSGAATGFPTTPGTAAGSFGFSATAAGVDRSIGAAAASFGFTGTASGTTAATVPGTAAAAFGFAGTALGVDRSVGQAVAGFGFAATAQGFPTDPGTSAGALGFSASALGTVTKLGSAVSPFGFAGSASGTNAAVVSGSAVGSFGFAASALGVDRAVGQAATTFGYAASALGVDRSVGQAVATFGFTGSASGTVVEATTTGQASGSFGFTASAVGNPRTPGTAVAAFSFAATASGVRTGHGTAAGTWTFTATVAGVGEAPSYTFSPPTYRVANGIGEMRRIRVTRSLSVIRVNGSLTTVKSPAVWQLEGTEGVDYFLGGRIYTITSEVKDELELAGFEVTP